jgi:hypothetical protein
MSSNESHRAWMEMLVPAAEYAKMVAGTDFVPKGLRDSPAAIAAAILYGDELKLAPMYSLQHIHVIDGKPALSAEAQRALIRKAGHQLWIEESTLTRCTWAGRHQGSEQTHRATWTIDDAKRAGIAGRLNWRQYPREMLLARASAMLARQVFADAIGGLMAIEELDPDAVEVTPLDSPELEPSPVPPTAKRRRRALVAPVATVSAPGQEPEPAPPPPLPGEEQPTLLTDEQRKRLMALYASKEITDRAERLAHASKTIGREIGSANELTIEEATQLIGALSAPDELVEEQLVAELDEEKPS